MVSNQIIGPIINGSQKLFIYLSLLFRTMFVLGYNPSDLLHLTITVYLFLRTLGVHYQKVIIIRAPLL